MSTNRFFDMEIISDNDDDQQEIYIDLCDYVEHVYGRVFDENWESFDPTSWTNHENDVMQFSKTYPDALLALTVCEEAGYGVFYETSVKYFKNGKMQVCKQLGFEPFDEGKLK